MENELQLDESPKGESESKAYARLDVGDREHECLEPTQSAWSRLVVILSWNHLSDLHTL